MEISVAIKGRRSIRKYKPGKIPEEDIVRILEAGMMAPSARNARPWSFVVVTDKKTKDSIVDVHPYAKMGSQAECIIVVCGKESLSEYWQQDCGAAIENMLLMAEDMGYGTCWCGMYPNMDRVEPVKEIIGETEGTPMALVVLGIPNENPGIRGKYEESKVRFID
ncbi:MAG: nitroreductase family protein [Candidatus Methanomethylophilaceae archaeon]